MMGEAVVAGGMAERCGYTNVERGCVELVASPLGEMHCALVWMGTEQMLRDLEAAMSGAHTAQFTKMEAAVT
jgi:hypothetical protein